MSAARPRAIARWLLLVAGLVFAMVVIGGITRLTESGLSITRWDPLFGAVPPLTDASWAEKFAAYRRIPQGQLNATMTLAEFKGIFFWEYLHRLVGRLIGVAFALPLIWFWVRGAIPAGYKPRLVALLALGGLQGAVGWWMVASGLTLRTEVSHIRLAVHLLLALFIMGGLIWTALDLRRGGCARPAPLGIAALAALALQVTLGAFTAGLRAGYAFDSWPLMGDRLFPEGGWHSGWSAIRNAIDNPIVVQFLHRWWAWVVVGLLVGLARAARRAGNRRASILVHSAFGTQILLGIATLMTGVNIIVAVAHQAVAALLVAATVGAVHAAGRRA